MCATESPRQGGLAASLEFFQLWVPFPSEGRTVCAAWIEFGTQGLQDEVRQTRHNSLNAPRLLWLCGPLSKHSACLERPSLPCLPGELLSGPLCHPCAAFPDGPGMHWTLFCAPAACCAKFCLMLPHDKQQDVIVRAHTGIVVPSAGLED